MAGQKCKLEIEILFPKRRLGSYIEVKLRDETDPNLNGLGEDSNKRENQKEGKEGIEQERHVEESIYEAYVFMTSTRTKT